MDKMKVQLLEFILKYINHNGQVYSLSDLKSKNIVDFYDTLNRAKNIADHLEKSVKKAKK